MLESADPENRHGIRILRPPEMALRILKLEAPGGTPADVWVTIPSVTEVGEDLSARVSVVDDMGYPSLEADGALVLSGPKDSHPPAEIVFRPGQAAVAAVTLGRLDCEGLFRITAKFNGRTCFSNPSCCRRVAGERIYWGDPHVHTVLSNCSAPACRSLNFCYTAARYMAGLDWTTAADHVSGGRTSRGSWLEQIAVAELFDDAPRFVTLPGYEASFPSGAGGDNNVYMSRWPDIYVDQEKAGNVKTLCQAVSEKLRPGEDFFVVPHHTTRAVKHGEISDEIYPGPDLMPVMEIHSKWGTSEYRGNPTPLKKIHDGPSYAVDFLNRGMVLGFIGGTDTHSTMPAGFGKDHLTAIPGLTAVLTPELTRQDVFDNIRRRNCYATALEKIYLDVRMNGQKPGTIVSGFDPDAPRKIEVIAAAQSWIESVDIVRNGKTVHSEKGGEWKTEFTFEDTDSARGLLLDSPHLGSFLYYYVRVNAQRDARAWSSPVWFSAVS